MKKILICAKENALWIYIGIGVSVMMMLWNAQS
jgi:hypothetical protein